MSRNSIPKNYDDITKLSIEERKKLAEAYINETDGLFPFILQKDPKSSLKAYQKPKVVMVTGSLKTTQLFQVFRKNNRLDETKALYLFVNGKTLLKSDVKAADIYYRYKQEDGFVYLKLSDIATWG